MSAALDMADMIRDRLLTAPLGHEIATTVDLTGMDVIIDRQTPITSLISAAVAKASGTAIVILWQGFTVPDANTHRPRLAHRYTITVFSQPVLEGAARPADNIAESIVNRLWHWVPGGGHAYGEAEVRNGDMVPDKTYLIYDIEIIIPVAL